MTELTIGFVMERKIGKFKLKKYDVLEFKELALGIMAINKNMKKRCAVATGNFNDQNLPVFPGDVEDGEKYYFVPAKLSVLISKVGNTFRFLTMYRRCEEADRDMYFHIVNNDVEDVEDKELIRYLVSQRKESTFSEDVFESETSISIMYNSIKQTIISQDEQIMQILTALFKNQTVINSGFDSDLIAKLKENVLIYGPTGTGKTEIIKRIAKLYKVPIVIEDATSLSETGYAGREVTDMLEDLCAAAGGNIEVAQRGILVIDEFDKLAEKPGDGKSHVSRFGVQRALLKLLDGSECYFHGKKFDTSQLTVVALGAFSGITEGDDYKYITADDLMRFGIMRELVGRFSKTIAMNPLGKDAIEKILKESDFSPINTYKQLFEKLNVKFSYTEDFIEYVAELAVAKNTGARSLKTVVDECISGALFRIFAGDYCEIQLVKPKFDGDTAYVLTKKKS